MSDRITRRKYAVVDLEATSPGRFANIIQVGIVIVEDGKITKTYATDVNPHEPLDSHIKALTGLDDDRLAKAPPFSQVARDIFDLLEDAVFVAHNVTFDANLLAEHLFLEGFELRTPRVDTVELAQVFFPTLEKYSLSYLSQLLSLDLEIAHTAISDAYATAQLLVRIQEKISSLPRQLLEKILQFADSLLFESRLVIEDCLNQAPLQIPKSFMVEADIIVKKQTYYLNKRAFSDDFQTNLALLGLDNRPKQTLFAQQMIQAFEREQVSFLQAQTGIGKTYASLLSLLSREKQQKLVVSVPTIALQNQLMSQEVRAISELFHLNAISLKSPRHYICLKKFSESLADVDKNRLVSRHKMQLLTWLFETETGDLGEIKQKQRYETYFDQIRHDGQLSENSLFYEMDFVKRQRDAEQKSHLIVTNHAYLLTRVNDDKVFLENRMVVIDEAQTFFLAVEQFSRARVDLLEQLQLIADLQAKPLALLKKRLLESLAFKCHQLVEGLGKSTNQSLDSDLVESLRQDLEELDFPELSDLAYLLSPVFSDFWLEGQFVADKRQIYLHGARFDLANVSELLPNSAKVFYISATLTISPQVSLASLLGYKEVAYFQLDDEKVVNQRIWLDSSMPMPKTVSEQVYLDDIAQRLMQISEQGQASLVLFTSRQAMLGVSERLEAFDIKHLCQDKHGRASHLKNRFDKGDSQLLLGTGTFWQGIDFASQTRLLEVIVRLPFDNPEDRFSQKVATQLRLEGKNPFYAYTLPLVSLRLKQAIGRTNRSVHQKSAVLILDSRICYKPYGQLIYDSLACQYQMGSHDFSNCLQEMNHYLTAEAAEDKI